MMMQSANMGMKRYLGSRYFSLKRDDFSKTMSWHQSGKKNSRYGTCWIMNIELEENKVIPKEEIQTWLNKGWRAGRCIDFAAYKNKPPQIRKNNEIDRLSREEKRNKRIADQVACKERKANGIPVLRTYYGTYNGHKFVKQSINRFYAIFGIDLTSDFEEGIEKIRIEMHKLYIEERLPIYKIEQKYGMTNGTLRHWLTIFGLK